MNVYFEFGEADGLRSRFLADAADFQRWLRELSGEFSGGYPPQILAKLAEIVLHGAKALKVLNHGEAYLIDRLMHDYWNFCAMTSRHGNQDITPSSDGRYPTELSQVLPNASDKLCGYYRRMFAGDTLAECSGYSYRSLDGVFRWSWLLPHEVADFCDRLESVVDVLDREDVVSELFKVLDLAKSRRSSLLISVA